jgi:tetratricopeptide (TPR) repeat protein
MIRKRVVDIPHRIPFRIIATSSLLCFLSACASSESAERERTPTVAAEETEKEAAPAATKISESFSPTGVCKTITELEDAIYAGSLGDVKASYTERSQVTPTDANLRFGRYWSEPNEKQRWTEFRDYSKEEPGSILGPLGNCLIYSKWKLSGQEVTFCNAVEERSPNSALTIYAKADMQRQKKNLPAALKLFKKATKKDPNCTAAWVAKAQVLAALGESGSAVKAWDAALATAPKCFFCVVSKAELIEKDHGLAKALPFWEKSLEIVPVHPATLQRYAAAQVGRNDSKALGAYEKALAVNGDDIPSRIAAARLAEKTKQKNKAIGHWQKVVELEPNSADGWASLAELYRSKREKNDEIAARVELARLKPTDGSNHLAMARIYKSKTQLVKAVDHFASALLHLASPAEDDDKAKVNALYKEAKKEAAALRKDLKIYTKPARGNINQVVGKIQFRVQQVYEERKKKKRSLSGEISVELTTDIDGAVTDLKVKEDSLGDPYVLASMLGNLRVAEVSGGRQKVAFALTFE